MISVCNRPTELTSTIVPPPQEFRRSWPVDACVVSGDGAQGSRFGRSFAERIEVRGGLDAVVAGSAYRGMSSFDEPDLRRVCQYSVGHAWRSSALTNAVNAFVPDDP